jgi:predicted ATP-dependent endonuclease of OLD family
LFKFESEKANDEKIYIFDEPDTHLHVKAQQDLYDIINKLTTT